MKSRGRLADALAEFARESGAEMLFDPKLVPRIDVRSVRWSLSMVFNSQMARFQGGERVRAQMYLYLSARRPFEFERGDGAVRRVEIGLEIVNLLDQSTSHS